MAVLGKYEHALECQGNALRAESDVSADEVYLNIGYVLRAMGKDSEAVAAFEKALEMTSDYPRARSTLEGLQNIAASMKMASKLAL